MCFALLINALFCGGEVKEKGRKLVFCNSLKMDGM